MNCAEAKTWIPRFLDGELIADEETRLNAHLSECSSCAWEVKILSLPRRLARAIAGFEPSPWFCATLRARLANQSQSMSIWQVVQVLSRQFVPVLAMVTLTLVTVFVYLQFGNSSSNLYQAYDMIFVSGDRPQRMVIADHAEITDESVIQAIAEDEPAQDTGAPSGNINRK